MGAIRAMTQPDTSSLPALFSPPSLLAMVLGAAISAPIYVVTAAAGAAAYRRIAGGRGGDGRGLRRRCLPHRRSGSTPGGAPVAAGA